MKATKRLATEEAQATLTWTEWKRVLMLLHREYLETKFAQRKKEIEAILGHLTSQLGLLGGWDLEE